MLQAIEKEKVLEKETIENKNFIKNKSRAWISINKDNLLHNVEEIHTIMPDTCKLMAVVKANAYGHGSIMIASLLNKTGIRNFAVATMQEGIELRLNGIKGDILVLGYTEPSLAEELSQYGLTQTIVDYHYGRELNSKGIPLKVQIKIDTGMHRLGFLAEETEEIISIFKAKNLKVTGIFTHLSTADSLREADITFTKGQIDRFYTLLAQLKLRKIQVPVHIQSTYGLLNYNGLNCDYARIGIGMYGSLSSAQDKTIIQPDIRPVLSLHSRVALIRNITDGESVGYGRAYCCDGNRTIAVIAIGYGDGYPRSLSDGKAEVIIKGVKVPIVGRICMDQLIVDITGAEGIHSGDIATLIGKEEKESITAGEVSDKAGTIANELLCRLGNRLPRIYV
ncbi:serine racemase VanT catalytic subunit [Anaerocolumna xylanovorans]|uniref:Alanine racemase n=1 Tax=Anaerocolumna xylanovorans DSM 12503 TaxID=1121345 RepID=A0A1M7XYY5_9FIRM|nr:serine racemase VanT catalytic subunit [Anaerocolumna xylanovorans]SHO44344.1 alanine racemase [Anaerocolumna xylanovorans DSM 12503]